MSVLRDIERESIRRFVASVPFHGRVLDLGCGLQPYRQIVEQTGATYYGFDSPSLPGSTVTVDVGIAEWQTIVWDAILCTQVIQYARNPALFLTRIREVLRDSVVAGTLVLTGPTNWPVVEPEDLYRFTPNGIRRLLEGAGFTISRLEDRETARTLNGEPFLLGWGAVAAA